MKLCPKCQKQFSDDANFCPVDAARLAPLEGQAASAPAADPLAQRFELGDRLGGGRTGAVHRAAERQGGAAAAVKLIAPAVVGLPGVAQRLERELKQLERVQSAGVARVLGSGRRGDDWWVAYELVDGAQTLAEAITARGPIPLDQAAHLIEVIGEALIEAAQVGVVHRDLAPKNILFGGDEIKLINFSVPVPGERTAGVPEFVAPEQVEGKPVDQRSNLYSLGALYYYVLTGQTPHAGTPDEVLRAHVGGSIRTPSSLAPVPGPVEAVIMRALDRSPTKRFLTVRQFVDEVGRVARGEAQARTTQPMGKAGRPKAELVQTLLGVRAGGPVAAAAVVPQSHPAIPPAVAALAANPPPAGTTMQGVGPGAPSSVPPPERSPWAPPSTVPPEPAVVVAPEPEPAPVAAAAAAPAPAPSPAPIAAADAVPSAPVVATAAAAAAAAPAGKKGKGAPAEADTKGKFRETLWFKKGDLDAQAAAEAASGKADPARDKADSLPMDERYKDDGTISRGDKEKYSLRTGSTQAMPSLKSGDRMSQSNPRVSDESLIGEMRTGRGKVIALIALAIAIIVAIIVVTRVV